ncbi:hypothetical protein KCU73_g26, partial [Aureobasidium melanogenum]
MRCLWNFAFCSSTPITIPESRASHAVVATMLANTMSTRVRRSGDVRVTPLKRTCKSHVRKRISSYLEEAEWYKFTEQVYLEFGDRIKWQGL